MPHHVIKRPDKVVQRALKIHSFGYGAKEIQKHLADEGIKVGSKTIEQWIYNGVRCSNQNA